MIKFCRIIADINSCINHWFMKPISNSAGRIGLFRIVYSFFYLWYLSTEPSQYLSGIPNFYVHSKVYTLRFFFPGLSESLTPTLLNLCEALLVGALIILAFGYKTRLATASVLVLGCFIESLWTSVDGQRTLVLMVFYIPFFMLITNSWAQTYSIDSQLCSRTSRKITDPNESHWKYFLPARALLIILCALFLSSAIFKVSFGGVWLSHTELINHFALNRNIKAAMFGLPLNWATPIIYQTPLVYLSIHVVTLLFEFFFFLSLFDNRLRNLMISTALVFHSVNALWFVITVTPVLIAYLAFVDWQCIKEIVPFRRTLFLQKANYRLLVFFPLLTATLTAILWYNELWVKGLMNFFGLIDQRTIWILVLPLSVFSLGKTVFSYFGYPTQAENI